MSSSFIFILIAIHHFLACGKVLGAIYDGIVQKPGEDDSSIYSLPNLPFGYADLEPVIDEQTIRIHHLGHHKSYTDKMNAALVEWKRNSPKDRLARLSIVDILSDLSSVPDKWRKSLKNNGGGYVNHILYWATMCKAPSDPSRVVGKLIEDAFGSLMDFKKEFSAEASKLFGSGYVWLCLNQNLRSLSIKTTTNQDSPISDRFYPILVIDIWEHAYYLKHQNRRVEYIDQWWNTVCWDEVEQLVHFWLKYFATSRKRIHTEF